jgi:hypothetical protein
MKNKIGNIFKSLLVYLAVILFTLEIAPFILGSFILEGGYSRRKIKQELTQRYESNNLVTDSTAGQQEEYLSEHMVHPYLGFVHEASDNYNSFGFPDAHPILRRSDSVVNICITGGSVAKQLYQFSGKELIRLLLDDPDFENKEINLVSLALGGFKQPQQLFVLNYLLSLGAEYDYVINIDGFNEVVLPYSDNMPFEIFPAYPRHWNVYSRKVLNKKAVLLLGKQAVTKEKQQRQAEMTINSPLRISNFGLFLWKIRDQGLTNGLSEMESQLRTELQNSEAGLQTRGPDFNYRDTTGIFAFQATYWGQCSRQMNALASQFGFTYLHFLQPNQYLEGSKKLTTEELTVAYEEGDFAYKKAVQSGYPFLIAEGKKLLGEGLRFEDLTQLFKNEQTTVYSDKCCHFNIKGYNAIMKKIAGAIMSGD